MNNNLSENSVYKALIKLSWPLIVANFLQTIYPLTDMLMAGRLISKEAMSAVAVGSQMSYLLTTLSTGVAAGGQIMISQQKGAKKDADINDTFISLFILSLIAGTLFSLCGFFFASPILKLLRTPEEAFNFAVSYMKITSWGLIFIFTQNAVNALFRALGESKVPMFVMSLLAALNIILNLFLVKVMNMGIGGLAVATVISEAASCFFSFIILKKKKSDMSLKSISISFSRIVTILKLGLPFGAQMAITSFANMFITAGVNTFGVNASAAMGAGVRVTNMLTVPMLAIGNAATTLVGQSMGAEDTKRGSKAVYCSFFYMIIISILTMAMCKLGGSWFISLFHDDREIIEMGAKYLAIVSWCFPAHSLHSAANAAALGSSFPLFSLFSSGTEAVLGRVGLTLLLSRLYGIVGIFFSQAFSPYLSAVISALYFLSGKWKKRDISQNL